MRQNRKTPVEISKAEFKKIGHQLIDSIADFIEGIAERRVTTGESPGALQNILGNASLPEHGTAADKLFSTTTQLLFDHSLLNGHPIVLG